VDIKPPLRPFLVILLAGAAAGCGASLQPLKAGPPPTLGSAAPLQKKIPLPASVGVALPDMLPSDGAKNTYPFKTYLEQAFGNAVKAAFAQLGSSDSYGYALEVSVMSSRLSTGAKSFGSSQQTAHFEAEINTTLKNPDGKSVQSKNFSFAADSDFDGAQVPEAVATVSSRLASDFLDSVRNAPWLRSALSASSLAHGEMTAEKMQALASAAAQQALSQKSEATAQAAEIHSDVDEPGYHTKENPDNFAVVVGIAKYSNIPEAEFADRDAAAVQTHLLAMGYPQRNIIMLQGEKATKTGLAKNVETWLPRNVSENSTVFFYFSGHGAPDIKTKEAYLVPWDGDPQFLEDTAYPVKRLYEKLGALKAKRVIVAMDSCFSGAGGRSVLAKGARPLVSQVDAGMVASDGKLVVFGAAAGDQISGTIAKQGHGAFTYYFLRGLGGAAKDDDGRVTVKSLNLYLTPNVEDEARRQNRDQTPQLMPAGVAGAAPILLR